MWNIALLCIIVLIIHSIHFILNQCLLEIGVHKYLQSCFVYTKWQTICRWRIWLTFPCHYADFFWKKKYCRTNWFEKNHLQQFFFVRKPTALFIVFIILFGMSLFFQFFIIPCLSFMNILFYGSVICVPSWVNFKVMPEYCSHTGCSCHRCMYFRVK